MNLAKLVIKNPLSSVATEDISLEKGDIKTSISQNGFDIDWQELRKIVFAAVHFLDNVVEINEFPVAKIREMVSKTRRIGVGVMGFADALFKLGVKI